MADESNAPEIIPGMVAVEFIGSEPGSGESKGMVKNVFPIDARELVATGNYKLYENGAAEVSRLNAAPLRAKAAKAAPAAEPTPAPAPAPAPAAPSAPASMAPVKK